MTDPHGTPAGQKRVKDVTYGESEKKTGQTKRKADNSDNVCIIHGVGHNSEKIWVIKQEHKKLKNKDEPNKETLLAMYRSATHKVSDLNYHSKKKKQV
jgi:hypothetical protein